MCLSVCSNNMMTGSWDGLGHTVGLGGDRKGREMNIVRLCTILEQVSAIKFTKKKVHFLNLPPGDGEEQQTHRDNLPEAFFSFSGCVMLLSW